MGTDQRLHPRHHQELADRPLKHGQAGQPAADERDRQAGEAANEVFAGLAVVGKNQERRGPIPGLAADVGIEERQWGIPSFVIGARPQHIAAADVQADRLAGGGKGSQLGVGVTANGVGEGEAVAKHRRQIRRRAGDRQPVQRVLAKRRLHYVKLIAAGLTAVDLSGWRRPAVEMAADFREVLIGEPMHGDERGREHLIDVVDFLAPLVVRRPQEMKRRPQRLGDAQAVDDGAQAGAEAVFPYGNDPGGHGQD